MWIRYDNGTEVSVARFSKLSVQKNFGGKKDSKFALSGLLHASSRSWDSGILLAFYETREKAVASLDRITAFFEENPNGIYKIQD